MYVACRKHRLTFFSPLDKDLKPSNILLSRDGVWLAGFDVALDYSPLENEWDDKARGTPRYFAPEVAAWRPNGRPADVFSLGCVLLKIMTLHNRGSLEFSRQHGTADPSFHANLDRLNTWLGNLSTTVPWQFAIRNTLSADPKLRPTVTDLLERLIFRR